jgi:hypothetical protein
VAAGARGWRSAAVMGFVREVDWDFVSGVEVRKQFFFEKNYLKTFFEQKSFGSFFQKRTASFLSSTDKAT